MHYFDCHQPYDPPPEFLHGDPQDRSTATAARWRSSTTSSRAIEALRASKRRWLLVLFADHGEGLGDQGEESHGYQVFESTVHVPLLFVEIEGEAMRPPADLVAAAVDRVVGLSDVFPTVLHEVGLPAPEGTTGRPLQEPAARETVYVESLAGSLQFGWAQVTGVRAAQATLVHAGAGCPTISTASTP